DGCNNHCTYCTIPQIRGKYKSKEFNDVLMEAAELAAEGVKEIILVAQDLTSYGIDLYDKFRLTEVIEEISKIEGVEQIRLLYCYPEKVDDNLISTIKNNPSVVKYIDIPLQHSSNKVLKLMGRKGTHEEYVALFEKLYKEIPQIAIRSTVMVGFPGETEEDFEDLLKFVDQVKPINLGVFMYSDEEDAPSCKLPNKVDEETKQRRYDILIDKLSQISREKKLAFVGKPLDVVYEDIDYDQGMFIGRSYISAPEIDSLVFFTSKKPLNAGENVKVMITDVIDDDLYGEAL
ncbi:MAG: MiaB/RimO family radical SAM methylthiotransferase, partial [Clostridia bacterium]|nr:MiaB/RimO family radical SAM methylthiotransferase [Clostridia bacterium]